MSLVPLSIGGWWHDYLCPTHGTELEPARDGIHPCPHGCELTGEPYAAAWLVYQHQALAREARFLSRENAAGQGAQARTKARQILDEYAAFYAEVSKKGWNGASEEWMLKGKLFSQALTEAQWAVQVADAVLALHAHDDAVRVDRPVVEMLQGLLDTILAARTILVDTRNDERNNYTAWLNTAGILLVRALRSCGEDTELAQWVAWSHRHVGLAVDQDGWEWEGSTYYHVFVLRAYLLGLRDLDPADIPAEVVQRLAAMVQVLVQFAAPSGQLPMVHDGPYNRAPMHREVLEIAVLAGGLFGGTGLDPVAHWARTQLGAHDSEPEDSLTDWFSGPPVDAAVAATRTSVYYPQVGFAVLRDDADTFQAVIDAGPHGGSHGHFDKLALYLYGDQPWQPAPGVPPYGGPLRRGYYARTLAHPTVQIDGKDQLEGTGQVDLWDAENKHIITRALDVTPGVQLERELMIRGSFLIDIVRVSATDQQAHDIILALRPAAGVSLLRAGETTLSHWPAIAGSTGPTADSHAGLRGFHRASVPASLATVPGRGTSEDPALIVPLADWQAHARDATFVSVYSFDPTNHPVDVKIHFDEDHVPSIQITSPAEEATTIEVSR